MRGFLVSITVFTGLFVIAACSYVSEYEKGVYNYEPIYCYKSIGNVQCYKTPNHRDEKRLVNYYGPAPSRYDVPAEPKMTEMAPPPSINYYIADQEPIPEPSPPKAKTLPWLGRKHAASPDKPDVSMDKNDVAPASVAPASVVPDQVAD